MPLWPYRMRLQVLCYLCDAGIWERGYRFLESAVTGQEALGGFGGKSPPFAGGASWREPYFGVAPTSGAVATWTRWRSHIFHQGFTLGCWNAPFGIGHPMELRVFARRIGSCGRWSGPERTGWLGSGGAGKGRMRKEAESPFQWGFAETCVFAERSQAIAEFRICDAQVGVAFDPGGRREG